MKPGRFLGMLAVCSLVGVSWAAGSALGNPPPPPNPLGTDLTPELAITPQMLATATQRGAAMFKAARWEAPVPIADLKGGSGATIALYDAGDSLIWWLSQFAGSHTVEKATGKPVGARSSAMLAMAGNDKGVGEMLTRRATSSTAGRPDTWTLELLGVVDGKPRWTEQTAAYTEFGFLAGTQAFTGSAVPGMIRVPLPPGASPMMVTETKLTLEMWAHNRDTGKKQWQYTLPAGTLSAKPFAHAEGMLYVLANGSTNQTRRTLLALNTADGTQVFAVPLETDISPLAVNGAELVALRASGELVGFDGKTGKEKWREPIWLSKEPGKVKLTAESGRDTAPVIAGDKLLVPVFGRTEPPSIDAFSRNEKNYMTGVAAFDARTHKQLWFFRPPDDAGDYPGGNRARQLNLVGLAAEKNHAVVATSTGEAAYLGVDLQTGTLDWYLPADSGNKNGLRATTKPVLSNGMVYLVKDAKLLALPLAAD